jgi:hypothetical protein
MHASSCHALARIALAIARALTSCLYHCQQRFFCTPFTVGVMMVPCWRAHSCWYGVLCSITFLVCVCCAPHHTSRWCCIHCCVQTHCLLPSSLARFVTILLSTVRYRLPDEEDDNEQCLLSVSCAPPSTPLPAAAPTVARKAMFLPQHCFDPALVVSLSPCFHSRLALLLSHHGRRLVLTFPLGYWHLLACCRTVSTSVKVSMRRRWTRLGSGTLCSARSG